MSELVTVLKFAFGFISNKVRTYGAEKLQDGGLVDQKFRGLIVRELDEIKFKLDANARKDLSAAISFLTIGVKDLQMCIDDQFVESGVPSTSELPEEGKQSQDTTNAGASSTEAKPAQKSVAIEDALALANAIGKLKIVSSERFESAKESFKDAGKEATRAFHNAALSTDERILASKVRIASGILEHLHDLDFAVNRCLHYLQELHDLPSVQDIFSVHVKGGIKSVFKKDSRLEIVETVTMINLILADFISKFTKRRMAVFDWPMIECGTRVVHPIHYEKAESLPNLKEMEITPPWDIMVHEEKFIVQTFDIAFYKGDISALNSKGDLICFCQDIPDLQKLDKTTGKLQPYFHSSLEDTTEHSEPDSSRKVRALVVDEDDIVYVISGDENEYTLTVYSADGRNKHDCTLKFKLLKTTYYRAFMTVNKDKNLVMTVYCGSTVYLCDSNNGELIKSFDIGLKEHLLHVFVSCNNEILVVTSKDSLVSGSDVLSTYTQQGQLQRTVKLRWIGNDYGHRNISYRNISYDSVTKTIISQPRRDKILIECYSDQTGLPRSYSLHETNFPAYRTNLKLVGHTNGTLALVGDNHVIFLQKPSQ